MGRRGKRRESLTQSGVTPENKRVIKGAFKLYDSVLGIPLCDMIDVLWERDSVIDWESFILDARESKMPNKSIKKLIVHGLADSMSCKFGIDSVDKFFEAMGIDAAND